MNKRNLLKSLLGLFAVAPFIGVKAAGPREDEKMTNTKQYNLEQLTALYGWPEYTIIVDRPPFNGSVKAALSAAPIIGNVKIILGSASVYDEGLITNTKPNIVIVGAGMPVADMNTKTLSAGGGSIIRGCIANSAPGFCLYNLGIDNGDLVRTSLLGGAYYDAYCNEHFGENANIQYGNLVIMQSTTDDGTGPGKIGLRHGIRSEWGSGVKQIGDVYINMGFHGHVIKCSDFIGSNYLTYGQGSHADTLIVKADAGTGDIQNIRTGNVICDGGDTKNTPIASTGGVVYEATGGASLTGVTIGNISARNARFALYGPENTDQYVTNIHIGYIDAIKCDDNGNIPDVIGINFFTIGMHLAGHNVRQSPNMNGLRVYSGPTPSNTLRTDDIQIGNGSCVGCRNGYILAGGVSHGSLWAAENKKYGILFDGYTGPGCDKPTFCGMGVNTEMISGRANGLGLISGKPSAIAAFLGTWHDTLSFSAVIVGSTVKISGRLGQSGASQENAVQMVHDAFPSSTVDILAMGISGNTMIPVEAKIDVDGILKVKGYESVTNEVSFYGEYHIK